MINDKTDSNEEWCVLVDYTPRDIKEYKETGMVGCFHIEPYKRYCEKPPAPRWKMYARHHTEKSAFEFLISDEAVAIFKNIYGDSCQQ